MNTKTCSRCKTDKPVSDFGKDNNRQDGLYPYCKQCKNKAGRDSYQKPEVLQHKKEYRKKYNADPVKRQEQAEQHKKWYAEKKDDPEFQEKERRRYKEYDNSTAGKSKRQKFRNSHKSELKEYHKKYAQEKGIQKAKERYHSEPGFREKMRKAIKRWFDSDKGKAFRESPAQKQKAREYRQKNLERTRERERDKYNNDPEYHARVRAKNNTRIERERAGGGDLDRHDWKFLVGLAEHKCLCCGEKVKLVMDHIVPVSSGGKTTIHNIQPLCSSCNSRKGKNVTDYRNDNFLRAVLNYLEGSM
jgi:5-methylcytosine-specific restriction endonuclease McrA